MFRVLFLCSVFLFGDASFDDQYKDREGFESRYFGVIALARDVLARNQASAGADATATSFAGSVSGSGIAHQVSSLPKCSIRDNDCQKELFQTVISSIGKTGVKELGIPPIDPFELKNVSVSVANILDITLVDGVVKGVKDCEIHKMITDVSRGAASMDLTCDITVKGHYKASSSSPLVKSLLGGNFVHGDGFGKVRVERIRLHYDFKIKVTKDPKGEVYLAGVHGQTKSKFEILGNLAFAADNIFLGDEDVSDVVVRILNQNGKSFAPFFGGPFMEKTSEFMCNITGKFFEVVPTRFYIKEDLSKYATE